MKSLLTLILIAAFALSTMAQQRIDGSFAFQTNPAKKYSIYVPSGYNAANPHKLMLGLHPFNTTRWNAISWCDTLIDFAEENNLILICPDGGVDGKVDDAIDTAFTSAILDSMNTWYNIDNDKVYAMGFSWGARTTYTYGLNNVNKFGGFLPIGAAITNTTEVTVPLQQNSYNKAFYIIHGTSDSPTVRLYPVRDSLIAKGAIVNTNLLSGVGHTIDFANRNDILKTGFNWIDSVNCYQLALSVKEAPITSNSVNVYPNPQTQGGALNLSFPIRKNDIEVDVYLFSLEGKKVLNVKKTLKRGTANISLNTTEVSVGTYILTARVKGERALINKKVSIE